MAWMESSDPSAPTASMQVSLASRLREWLRDRGDRSLAQRVASTSFLIRVLAAGLAFLSQVLLARWMSAAEFGIYIYVSTWVMVIGGIVDIGIASSAQRFIPQYSEKGDWPLLRGFLSGGRRIAFHVALAVALLGIGAIYLFREYLDESTILPLMLGCLILPVYALMHVQDGIARSYDWPNLALLPAFVLRQLIIIALMGSVYALGWRTDAAIAVAISAIAIWVCAVGQLLVLNRKLTREVAAGDQSYDIPNWIFVSIPMFIVDGIYMLLMYVDILILKQFRPAEEIAVYFAAAKTVALVSLIYFSVAGASAHKFSEYAAAGDRAKLTSFTRDAIRWTFWPSLTVSVGVLALGWPLLRLFGESFVSGYSLMFVLVIGILARAAIGPGERFLAMLGEQKSCAAAAFCALAVHLGLCFALIPAYGAMGAAVSVSLAFIVESTLIFLIAKYRLGFHLFVFGGKA